MRVVIFSVSVGGQIQGALLVVTVSVNRIVVIGVSSDVDKA